jgi:hypothetical protein
VKSAVKTPVKNALGNIVSSSPAATPTVCTNAINYTILIAAMPTTVNGYAAGTPSGNTMTFTNPADQSTITYSTASVLMSNADKSIDITAVDTCYISYLSMAWSGFYESDGTDGFAKKTTIGSYPAWHQYTKSSNSYSYDVLVSDRFFITVAGSDGVSDDDVTAAANAVNYGSIVAAAT